MVFKHVLMLKSFGIAHRTGIYHLPTKNIFWVTFSLDLPYEAQPVGYFQAKIRVLARNIWFMVRLHNGNRFGAWPKGSIPIYRSLEWFWILIIFEGLVIFTDGWPQSGAVMGLWSTLSRWWEVGFMPFFLTTSISARKNVGNNRFAQNLLTKATAS